LHDEPHDGQYGESALTEPDKVRGFQARQEEAATDTKIPEIVTSSMVAENSFV
jgi:hypothetical protein